MNVNDIFPSNYLKAADLKGSQVRVAIDRVEVQMVGQGDDAQQKPIIYFIGKDKGLWANKTNMNAIAMVYGPETDDWHGAEIVLFEAMVDFQGKVGPAIRVRIPPRKPVAAVAPRPLQVEEAPAHQGHPFMMDDDITF